MASGLDPHTAGEVERGVTNIGYVFQDATLLPWRTVRKNVELLAELDGGVPASRIDEVLDLVDLSGREQRVGGFSSGMRQRLGLAAALLRAPRLLLVDEPTTGLDPAGARDLRDLVRRLPAEGVTVLLSSHDMAEVDAVCDGVTIMSSGRVVWDGTVARLWAEAPAPAYRLWTSDDTRALELASREARVHALAEPDDGLSLTVEEGALDDYVLALGRAGVAVRRLELLVSPLESMFFALTGERSAPAEAEPETLGAAR
jgi:ABC-2 type transport system ATP-binding protein